MPSGVVTPGGGGGAPSGSAGGDLSGSTYPNPIVKQGVYWFNVQNPPYNAKGDGSTDDAPAIQAAIDAAAAAATVGPAVVWLPTPSASYLFETQLQMKGAVTLAGPGFQGNGPILNWAGADATHAIVNAAGEQSRMRLYGFQLQDGRSAPSSGDGIHITGTNGTVLHDIGCTGGFPTGSAIYLGATSGTPDNFTVKRCWLAAKNGYGLTLDHMSENCIIEDIKGDGVNGGILALIRLLGNAAGDTSIQIRGAKTEVSRTDGTQVDQIYIDSSFRGRVDCTGLFMSGPLGGSNNVGYVINNQSTAVHIAARCWGTNQGVLGFLNDGPTSRVFGASSQAARYPDLVFESAGAPAATITLGNQLDDVRTITNAGVTLDGSYSTVLVSAGASGRTINLPAASASAGYRYRVKKTDSGVGAVTVTANGGDLIDGAGTFALSLQYNAVDIICDGTGWNILSKV